MRLLHRSGVCALALVAGAAALQFEPTVLRNVVFDNGSQRVEIGAVKTPLWSAAFAQSADTFNLENVRFSFAGATYEAKRIAFSGVTSPRAEIEALFSSASNAPVAERLAKINAKQVTIPELKMAQKIGPETQNITYRNVVFTDIVQGKIASTTVDATLMESGQVKNMFLFNYGKTSIADMDLAALARLYETKADSDSAPLVKIHGAFSMENITGQDDKEGVSFKIARFGGRDFMARPTRDSWTGTTVALTELGSKENLTEAEQARLMVLVADLFSAFDIGLMEATGIDIKVEPNQNGKKAPPTNVRINRAAYTGSTGGQPTDIRIEGMEARDPDSTVKIGTASLTGFSLAPTFNGLKNLKGKSLENLDPATARSLAPVLGSLRFSGIDIDALSRGEGNSRPERVKLTLAGLEVTADKPVNSVPTNIRFGVQNLAMTLPSNSKEEGIKQLMDLGYKAVDMSFAVSATWNEATNEIAFKEAFVQGGDMGSVSLTGTIGNVTKDVFTPDTATATLALMNAKAKSLDVVVENKGLFERYLAKAAKDQKTTPENLRRSYATAAPTIVTALLGGSDQAKALGQAVATFINKPGKLTLKAVPKNPAGFGVMDAALVSEPKDVLDKLTINTAVE